MKIKIAYKSVVVCSVILGVFISIQLKTLNLENNGMTTSKKGEQLAVELKRLKKEENELKSQIESIKNNIDKYKGVEGDEALKSEIEEYEVLAGYTDVKGPGIEVKMNYTNEQVKSPEVNSTDSIAYNYDLILSMINKLNSAQADAISVNGQRIVANTYFHLKEDSLYMDDNKISEPITIKAIGDSDTLASALQIKYGIVWEIEKYYNYKVDIDKKENLKINAHNQKIESEYSSSDSEG
ncbi:DUF881 domain-containing protein [Romboutsia sp.]|uniref:DUF881 domain-containing protein n=1 Tax=Romboutsia sp. TaxID=1965302 RepID=UPI003F3F49CE